MAIDNPLSKFWRYVLTFFLWLVFWQILIWIIEFSINNSIIPLVAGADASLYLLDLPGPIEYLSIAHDKFPDVFGIFNNAIWAIARSLLDLGALVSHLLGLTSLAIVLLKYRNRIDGRGTLIPGGGGGLTPPDVQA